MSIPFVPFDELRGQLKAAFEAADLPNGVPRIYVVRDLFGRVGISVSEEFDGDDRLRSALERLAREVHRRLGAHGRPAERVLLWSDPGLLGTLESTAQEIAPGVVLADRLTAGRGWWTLGEEDTDGRPLRYTLYSIKGGVGRSTTVAVLAWHLARRGEDVLAVDLDLESPGLAPALFEERARPDFGVADWFVEELVGQGDRVLPDMVGSPAWARDLPGNVWVAPAHGRDPGEYLAKLGRVYMDTASDPWTLRLRRMLHSLETRLRPTVVLLESRSGLHDIAAATLMDVGAEVLLFGVDSPATWTGYRVLFEHWRVLGLASKIRERLSLVSGLTPNIATDRYLASFRENAWDLFRDCLYDTLGGAGDASADPVSYDVAEEDAPHSPLVIHWNRGFAGGTPLRRLGESVVMQAYAPFLERFGQQHRGLAAGEFGGSAVGSTFELKTGRPSAATRDAEIARAALRDLPEGTSHGAAPPLSHVYLSPAHRKALDPDVLLVTGMRGAGKTFWWSALQQASTRKLLALDSPQRRFPGAPTDVGPGFGVVEAPNFYPGPDEIRTIIASGSRHRDIWRTVHAHQLAEAGHSLKALDSWSRRVKHVEENPEGVARLFRDCDGRFDRRGRTSLLLFDGLDRSADDWPSVLDLIRGLLRHALDMRSFRRLRAKVFLRLDQAQESCIADFPDASKVLNSSVELSWPRDALYGMLWQYLGNGDRGEELRPLLGPDGWEATEVGNQLYFRSPAIDEETRRKLFHSVITGPWMGRDRRRGFPYTWIPNHLGDADGNVSPRSFIEALRAAAANTADRYPDYRYALHYESVKRGVREASKIRIRELGEDYPWVELLLRPLSGTVVPCAFDVIKQIWQTTDATDGVSDRMEGSGAELPPRGLGRRGARRREDLEAIGVFRRLRDGRVDIPDVFRVGYGLGRKGGVRPVT